MLVTPMASQKCTMPLISVRIQKNKLDRLHTCDAYGLIVDESTGINSLFSMKDGRVATLFFKSIEIPDQKAETT